MWIRRLDAVVDEKIGRKGGDSHLKLVLLGLSSRAGVEKINGENLDRSKMLASPNLASNSEHPQSFVRGCISAATSRASPSAGQHQSINQDPSPNQLPAVEWIEKVVGLDGDDGCPPIAVGVDSRGGPSWSSKFFFFPRWRSKFTPVEALQKQQDVGLPS